MFLNTYRVKTSYPNEGEHINQKQDDIQELWDRLEDKAEARKSQLAQSRDTNKFHSDAKDLVSRRRYTNELTRI